jgi:hypothetical protein
MPVAAEDPISSQTAASAANVSYGSIVLKKAALAEV